MFYYYYDWTYILVLIGVVLSLLAGIKPFGIGKSKKHVCKIF